MNLNNPNAYYIQVISSETNVLGYLSYRTKAEKLEALKKCKEEGKEENLNALCSYCRLDRRKVEKKDVADPHYGCTKKCCPMLHYWDMCSYCIQDVHHHVVSNEEIRRTEVVTFQRVFSRLPEDTQHYISEYVPHVFTFVRSLNRVIGCRLFGTVERQLNLPKRTWTKVQHELHNRYAARGLTSQSSRKQICEKVKDLYKRMYNKRHQQITEQDFWAHRPHAPNSNVFYNNTLVGVLEKIQTILHN
jgi:hypothetical protein